MSSEAVEQVGATLDGRVVWTCEHASARIPDSVDVDPADRPWFRTHWGHDRGAVALVDALQARLGGPAVHARFSRLVVDANRPPDHPDLCRERVDGVSLRHNRAVSAAERARRVSAFHAPYHDHIDALLSERTRAGVPSLLFSVHTFTSSYEGRPRAVDLGVLFDETDTGGAVALLSGLSGHGLVVAANAPWSGMDGLVYSIARHGAAHRVPYLELEVRDLLLTGPDPGGPLDPVPVDAAGVARVAELVAAALSPILAAEARVGVGRAGD